MLNEVEITVVYQIPSEGGFSRHANFDNWDDYSDWYNEHHEHVDIVLEEIERYVN